MRGAGYLTAAIACALSACSHPAPPPPPKPPAPVVTRSRTTAPRVATFAPTSLERAPEPVETTPPPPRRPTRVSRDGVSDADIVHEIRLREQVLHRCFETARRADPSLLQAKVPVRVRIGAAGRVEAARASSGDARLDACVAGVVSRMSFPPPGAPIEVEVPLFFAARW